MYQMGNWGIPFVIVFTKSDKLKPEEIEKYTNDYKNALLEDWDELPTYFVSSAVKKEGAG